MALYRAEGVVIRTRDLGEADKILVIYTRERGKVSGVARGVRKPRSRLLAGCQLFAHSQFALYEGRSSLHTVTQTQLVNAFRPLREDLVRMAYASYAAELLDVMVAEAEADHMLFRTVLEGFTLVAGADGVELAMRWFELRLLGHLGYLPELHRCVVCFTDMTASGAYSAAGGGALCRRCAVDRAGGDGSLPLTAMLHMRRLLETPATGLASIRPSAADRQTMDRVIQAHLRQHLHRPLRSREFLDSVVGSEGDAAFPAHRNKPER